MFKALKWEDWMGIVLGAWLLVSPWVLGFSGHEVATMNALVMGTILMLEEMLELGVHETVEEWIDIVAGLWLVISPVALGFASLPVATASTMAVGFLTVITAAMAISSIDERIGHWWHEHVTGA